MEPLRTDQPPAVEAELWLAWLIPFLRVTGVSPSSLASLSRAGVQLADFARPGFCVPYTAMVQALEGLSHRAGNRRLGLDAAASLTDGDFGAIGRAVRSSTSLREAIACGARLTNLLQVGVFSSLREERERAIWTLHFAAGCAPSAVVDDFVLSAALRFAQREASEPCLLQEVHFRHVLATPREYARSFGDALLRFGMPNDALVFARANLDATMRHTHVGLQAVFELEAISLQPHRKALVVGDRVRPLLAQALPRGEVRLSAIARSLAMSPATLRRRLELEQTTFSELLDHVRRELAGKYVRDPALRVNEISALLGFSHVSAFSKAYRRWHGVSVSRHRGRSQANEDN